MDSRKNRDPRKNVRGSRSGSRGAIRPRVQSQTGHDGSSQPGYRPEMYPQSPPFFYTQQPLPQLPTNFEPFDYQYTQQPPQQPPPQNPTNFNPYEPRYNQQKRRERVSEPLPIHEEDDDDEYYDNVNVVPETQQIEEEEEQVQEVSRPKSGKKNPLKFGRPMRKRR